ncbi:MAG: septation protein A [Rhodocyclaceae bacterium]|nr:septation protein A [Rhodocyclaceae bacterium]
MKFLFDLFPVILFFTAFKLAEGRAEAASSLVGALLIAVGLDGTVPVSQAPILVATLAAIVGTVGQVVWLLALRRKVDTMLWVSLVLIVVMGGATLALHDETFIKWKPTVLYWLFSIALLVSAMVFEKNIIKNMLEKQMSLSEELWAKLNLSWVAFFALMGALNLVVAFNYPTAVWVNFKLFGGTGLMVMFVLAQGMVLSRYMEEKD